jgi:hypothetical protein
MFTSKDLSLLAARGITPERVQTQLKCFSEGFPFLPLHGSASVDHGILRLNEAQEADCRAAWEAYLKEGHRVLKFVPASGAASRMFKDLFAFLEGSEDTPDSAFTKTFFQHLHRFAFAQALDACCREKEGCSLDELLKGGAYKTIIALLLTDRGLNYGSLPKGLLDFHRYDEGVRKAVTEHLVEGALYANCQGQVFIHFTVSPEHRSLFEAEIHRCAPDVEQRFGVCLHVSFSEQKSSTDTIAADANNAPFRENDALVFRPGGHGALLENLNELEADVVFIKNIDNVVPDSLKDTTVRYKQALAGLLVQLQAKARHYLGVLNSGQYDRKALLEIIRFLQHELCTRNPETKTLEDSDLAIYLKHKLNRPIRVCGMVRNEGEPGGGPFWAQNNDGTVSLHILESSQIDLNNPEAKSMFEQGTHFNPVDLVCALRDADDKAFDLSRYTDPKTGFISLKSKNGKALKALELPGLWNGAMSDWNTVFVEVPVETFNPVKTVNDLLRPQHQ